MPYGGSPPYLRSRLLSWVVIRMHLDRIGDVPTGARSRQGDLTVGAEQDSSRGRSVEESAALMRGAFRGFGVLVIGGLAQPLASLAYAPLGYVWLPLVAVIAFVWAAAIACPPSPNPLPTGVLAALGAYLLAVPLVLMASGSIDLLQVALTSATAASTGAATGAVTRRRQSKERRTP
jgi:hypothetical protein